MQIPGNELLTSIGVGQGQLVVGIAYKISAFDRGSYIAFIIDSQCVT